MYVYFYTSVNIGHRDDGFFFYFDKETENNLNLKYFSSSWFTVQNKKIKK